MNWIIYRIAATDRNDDERCLFAIIPYFFLRLFIPLRYPPVFIELNTMKTVCLLCFGVKMYQWMVYSGRFRLVGPDIYVGSHINEPLNIHLPCMQQQEWLCWGGGSIEAKWKSQKSEWRGGKPLCCRSPKMIWILNSIPGATIMCIHWGWRLWLR